MKKWLAELKEKYFGIDGALVLLGLIVLLVALWFFFMDDGLRSAGREMTPVGRVTDSRNDVRRRIHTGFTWSNVGHDDTVYEGDSIFTGEESDASIDLNGGSRLRIDPKSLVVVRTKGNGLELDLQYGSLVGKVSEGAPLLITQNGEVQELTAKNAEIRIEAAEGKETKVQVIKGELELRPLSNNKAKPRAKQTVRVNEVVEFKQKSEPVIRKISATLLSPVNGKLLWLPLGSPLNFKWSMSNAVTQSRLELARDVTFDSPIFATDVAGLTFTLPEDKRPGGTFHWRVRPIVSKANGGPNGASKSATEESWSSSSTLTVYPDVPPLPTFPSNMQEFAFNTALKETNKQVALSWEDDAGSTDYAVVVAADEKFSKIVFEKKVTSLSERTPPLAAGKYFWRVTGQHAQRVNPPPSRTMSFLVEEEAREPLSPKLTQTKIDYQIPLNVLERTPAATLEGRGVIPEGLTPFQWTAPKDAETFEVEIAENESFANSLKQEVGKETSFLLREVKPGPSFIRVRAKGRKGLVSPPSETGRLEVQLPPPALKTIAAETTTYQSEEELARGKHEFKLDWAKLPFAETYEVQWGTDKEFSKSKKFRLKETTRSITVTKPMDYTARVRALGYEGTPLSPFSEVQIAAYRKEVFVPPPPAPVVQPKVTAPTVKAPRTTASVGGKLSGFSPQPLLPLRNSQVVSLESSNPFVNFKWRALQGAESYELQLAEDADFDRVISTTKAQTTTYTMQKALPEGRIFWRVRAKSKDGFSDWSPVFDINVLYE